MALYKEYAETKAIAVYGLCNFGGIEILDFEVGFDNYVVACFNFGTGRQKIRRHKVCFTPGGRDYIWMNHTRYYLDQFMRVA